MVPQVFIEALETPWGTSVNGNKIGAATPLKSGDIVVCAIPQE
jgi:hypothetical protein